VTKINEFLPKVSVIRNDKGGKDPKIIGGIFMQVSSSSANAGVTQQASIAAAKTANNVQKQQGENIEKLLDSVPQPSSGSTGQNIDLLA
jgi:hypothetical protein